VGVHGRGQGWEGFPRETQAQHGSMRSEASEKIGQGLAGPIRRTATRGKHWPATLDRWTAGNQASHSRGGTALKANYPASYPSIWAASVGAVTLKREVDCVKPNSLSPESRGRGGGSRTGVGDPRDLNIL